MLIFLFITTIYCAANLYVFWKITSFLDYGSFFNILIGLILFIMTISPVLIPIHSHKGSEKSVKFFSYVGYMWLAFLVPFFPAGVAIDLYNLIVHHGGSYLHIDPEGLALPLYSTFIVPLTISLVIIGYGYFEARSLCVERLTIRSEKLPEGIGSIRLAQISDLHLGIIVNDRMLEKVVQTVNAEEPDIIVSTGDLVDGNIRHIKHLPEKIGALRARLGKYAITGNHEVYGGLKNTAGFIEDSGFVLLRNSGTTIDNMINIAGMDFSGAEAIAGSDDSPVKREDEVLSDLVPGLFTILLKHRTDVNKESLGQFDLQLSGHTHNGQIFPMQLATKLIFPHHNGLTMLDKGSSIYVSRGTGTAGPPVRFLSRPEITIIDIVPGKQQA